MSSRLPESRGLNEDSDSLPGGCIALAAWVWPPPSSSLGGQRRYVSVRRENATACVLIKGFPGVSAGLGVRSERGRGPCSDKDPSLRDLSPYKRRAGKRGFSKSSPDLNNSLNLAERVQKCENSKPGVLARDFLSQKR